MRRGSLGNECEVAHTAMDVMAITEHERRLRQRLAQNQDLTWPSIDAESEAAHSDQNGPRTRHRKLTFRSHDVFLGAFLGNADGNHGAPVHFLVHLDSANTLARHLTCKWQQHHSAASPACSET